MRIKLLPIAVVLLFSVVAVSAQVAQISGKVTLKQADGSVVPVAGAVVDIYRTDIKLKLQTTTNVRGEYRMGVPFVGTFTIAVSAPGTRPDYRAGIRATQQPVNDFILMRGDGSRLTLEQIQAMTSAGSAPAATNAPTGDSAESKAARAELEQKIREVEEKNREITRINEVVARTFKAGNEALFTNPPRYDEAITNYREGLAARPDEVALLTNLAEALRQRADNRYNAAVKQSNPNTRSQQVEAAKKDWAEGAVLASKAVTLVKAVNPTDETVSAAGYAQNKRAAISVRALLLRRVVAKVDPTKAAEALAANQEYAAIETDPVKKWKIRGETLQALFDGGAIDLAVTEARKLLSEDPNNLDANRILGLALFASGDKAKFQEAANYLQRYVDKAPDTDPLKQSAKEALDYLKTVENITPQKTAPPRTTRRQP